MPDITAPEAAAPTPTPGPWSWSEDRYRGGYSGIVGPDGQEVLFPNTANDGDTGAAWFEDFPSSADAALIEAAPDLLAALIEAADLAWVETREVRFDPTVVFGHGYGGFDALDCLRQEIHSSAGSFMIWPDQIGGKKKWSAYGGPDGVMWFEKFETEAAAKAAVVAELALICPDHPSVKARAAIAKALGV